MPRILAIDYGAKRTGIAVTDPLQIIATGLTTIDTKDFIPFIRKYIATETVELFLIGDPRNMDGTDTHATPLVAAAIKSLKKHFPLIPIETIDERFTSKMAVRSMIEMGMKKSQRRDKKLIDEIAATMMLQEFMANRN